MEREINSDIYMVFPCAIDNSSTIFCEIDKDPINESFIREMSSQSQYECSSNIYAQLNRFSLGKYKFACTSDTYEDMGSESTLDDKNIMAVEIAHLILTQHLSSELCLLTMIIPQNRFDITSIEDQMSTGNIYLSDADKNIYYKLDQFLHDKYRIKRIDDPKCIVCLPQRPADDREFICMLAGEAFESEHVHYLQRSKEIEEISKNNVAQYDFYEAYVSSKCLVYIFKNFLCDYSKNLCDEVAILFICELILFQNAAIARTNKRIIEELSFSHKVSLKSIEDLYSEFGKTILFWDTNNFKYVLPQNLSNAILTAFGTQKLLESYYRNQSHLEHIVELRNSQSAEREGLVINVIAILLAIIQIIPLIIDAVNFFVLNNHEYLFPVGISFSGLFALFFVAIIAKRLNRKKRTRSRK